MLVDCLSYYSKIINIINKIINNINIFNLL